MKNTATPSKLSLQKTIITRFSHRTPAGTKQGKSSIITTLDTWTTII